MAVGGIPDTGTAGRPADQGLGVGGAALTEQGQFVCFRQVKYAIEGVLVDRPEVEVALRAGAFKVLPLGNGDGTAA